jgi:hypothetical protein
MKYVLTSAVAFALATPAAAQTTPEPQPNQGQHAAHQQGAAAGHGQHADHGQRQAQAGTGHADHKGCCGDADRDGRMDCCEAAQAGQRPCCAEHADKSRAN